MKGLEEFLEYEEDSVELQKRVVLHVSAIIISTVLLIKDLSDFLKKYEKK